MCVSVVLSRKIEPRTGVAVARIAVFFPWRPTCSVYASDFSGATMKGEVV